MSVWRQTLSPLLGSLLLLVGGCEIGTGDQTAEGGIGGSGSGNGQYAEGGMGGSGSGTTTGYGSIYVNEDRYYQIAEHAEIWLDGDQLQPNSVNATGQTLPLGMVVEFLLGDDASDDMTGGTVVALEAHHRLIGPAVVEDGKLVRILGQTVLTDFRTRYQDIEADEIADGTLLKVDGHVDRHGRVHSTRIAAVAEATTMQLVGRVTDSDAGSLKIGSQEIDTSNAATTCDTPLDDREVLVRAPDGQNAEGALLASEVRCLADGLSLFRDRDDVPSELPATAEGLILGLDLIGEDTLVEINLGGQRVDMTQVLPVVASTLAGLELGTRLEVDGILNTETGVLQAKRLRLRDPRNLFEIIAPIAHLTDGEVQLLGIDIIGLPAASGNVLDALTSDGWAHITGFAMDGEVYAFAARAVQEQDISLTATINAVDNDLRKLLIQDVPYLLDTATSITLLGSDGLLVSLLDGFTELLVETTCTLLPLLCPPESSEPDLTLFEGQLAQLLFASRTDEELEGGEIIIINADTAE